MEFVYVVKRYDLFDLEFPHGFEACGGEELQQKYLRRIAERGFFAERRFCEEDSSFKQIIPYAIVSHGDRVLLLKRLAGQGERRLHDKLSIGVGGHINPVDGVEDLLAAGCRREITEELHIDEPFEPLPLGVINDESNPVGAVHFGVVHKVRLERGAVRVREQELMDGHFVPLNELKMLARDGQADMESWSRLIIDNLDSIVSR